MDDITKLYYSISEVGRMLDLEPYVLRYWETEFDVLQPRKNRAGRRIYTQDDIAVARRIQHLLREDKYTIEGARQVLAREADGANAALHAELRELRDFLSDLRERI